MAAITSTITFDFTKTNPVKRWQFNPNGADGYIFSDNQITGPTAQTVVDGSLFKVSRSSDEYDGLTEGDGAYIYTVASINELLNINSQNTFVKSICIIPKFATRNNYGGMIVDNTQQIFDTFFEGRWINSGTGFSEMYRGRIRFINWSNDYVLTGPPDEADPNNLLGGTYNTFTFNVGYNYYFATAGPAAFADLGSQAGNAVGGGYDNYYAAGALWANYSAFNSYTVPNAFYSSRGGTNGQFKYLNFTPGTTGAGSSRPYGDFWDKSLMTFETVRFEIPFAITIPQFQHVYEGWPWNKSRKTLTTDFIFTSIDIVVTYDTVSEYKLKFFSDLDITAGNNFSSSTVYLDKNKTRTVPQGYLATGGKHFIVNASGLLTAKRTCQATITLTASVNGTVSSSYPSAASGYGSYSFNEDVSYITLDASPNYPIIFDRWEAIDFDGNTSTISYDPTINVYNGLYASIQPIFSESAPPPPTPQSYEYAIGPAGSSSGEACSYFSSYLPEVVYASESQSSIVTRFFTDSGLTTGYGGSGLHAWRRDVDSNSQLIYGEVSASGYTSGMGSCVI
jgi:hypothetical protein